MIVQNRKSKVISEISDEAYEKLVAIGKKKYFLILSKETTKVEVKKVPIPDVVKEFKTKFNKN